MAVEHQALLHRTDEELLTVVAPLLRHAVERGEPAVLVTTPPKLSLLRDGLGGDAASVRYVDAADWYVQPAAAIAGGDTLARELLEGGASRLRVVGEPPFGPSPASRVPWTRYEAIVSRVFRRLPIRFLCLYDLRTLPEQVVGDAYRTHPTVWEADRRQASPGYVEPEALLRQLREPDLAVVGDPSLRLAIGPEPNGWRRQVAAALTSLALPAGRAEEFLIAVSEVAANALRHGGGRARLALWVMADRAVCEVRDRGHGMDDPFAGYLPPGGEEAPGMGLWVARQLSDDLTIRSGPGNGTTVQLAIGR